MVGEAVERVVAETGLVLGVADLVGPIKVRFMTSAPDFFGAQPGPQELISISHLNGPNKAQMNGPSRAQ